MKLYSLQQGRSMVEMMGYMFVVLTVVVAIGNLVTNVFEEHKYSRASIQLTDLVGIIVKAAAIDPDYKDVVNMINGTSDDANKNAEGKKMIPYSFRIVSDGGKNILYHVFGGEAKITLNPLDEEDGDNKFGITFTGLTRKQCMELAIKDWQKNQYADLYAVKINSNDVWYWPVYKASPINSLPITRAKLTGTTAEDMGLCSENGKKNQVMWVFF